MITGPRPNLYLHYAFDHWMKLIPFIRYADAIVCHCRNRNEAETLWENLEERLEYCKLQLHPVKTKMVYCKDNKHKGSYSLTLFDFLGFSFYGRTVQDRQGRLFIGFNPEVSRKSLKRMNESIRPLDQAPATFMAQLHIVARDISMPILINYFYCL